MFFLKTFNPYLSREFFGSELSYLMLQKTQNILGTVILSHSAAQDKFGSEELAKSNSLLDGHMGFNHDSKIVVFKKKTNTAVGNF